MMRASRALALAAALAAGMATSAAQAGADTCDWSRPGARDYQGEVPAAVDSYTDIPAATRARLKARMAARQYDELVTITRDAILGAAIYSPVIWDMHWRGGLCRGTASRAGWRPADTERGLVYCEDGHCILVPTVCRNVSRVKRLTPAGRGTPGAGQPGDAGPEPIDISPGAGSWINTATQPIQPAGGTGLRLPPVAGPAADIAAPVLEVATATPAADQAGPADGWRAGPTLLDLSPAGGLPPVILPAPVPAVPEAPGWALMSIGAAAIFMAARRRA